MDDVKGKVAVVTGAASGIGRGMAETFCDAGMKVVLSDIEEVALAKTARELGEAGYDVHPVVTDVGKVDAVEALAKESIAKYGKVHVLCNNAGVGAGGGLLWETSLDDWEWVIDVNLKSVVYGIRAFVPHMLEHGEPSHIVNTASLAGLIGGGGGPYTVTKFGVVGLSEILFQQLERAGGKVSASVLCPAWVNTKIMDSERNRPGDAPAGGGDGSTDPMAKVFGEWVGEQLRKGLDPRDVGDTVLQAIRDNRFYILTHPDWTPMIEARMKNIVAGNNPVQLPPPNSEDLMRRIMEFSQKG